MDAKPVSVTTIAGVAEVDHAIATLVLAFATDPIARWMYDDPHQYLAYIPRLFRALGTSSFDAGAAWENLALEATRRELVAHAMEGFDYERAKTELSIPNDFDVNAMIAIGRRAPAENLPDKYREMERPSRRRPLHEIVFEGAFGQQIPGLP